MLKFVIRCLSVALCCGFHISFAESVLNKCTDDNQITYTDKPCEKLGLKNAGPLKNSVTEIFAPNKPQISEKDTHENKVSDAKASKPEQVKPVKLLLDKAMKF